MNAGRPQDLVKSFNLLNKKKRLILVNLFLTNICYFKNNVHYQILTFGKLFAGSLC